MIDGFRRVIACLLGGFVAIVTFGLVQVSMSGKTSGADNDDARDRSTLAQPLARRPEPPPNEHRR